MIFFKFELFSLMNFTLQYAHKVFGHYSHALDLRETGIVY